MKHPSAPIAGSLAVAFCLSLAVAVAIPAAASAAQSATRASYIVVMKSHGTNAASVAAECAIRIR